MADKKPVKKEFEHFCPVCERGYILEGNLANHIHKKHPDFEFDESEKNEPTEQDKKDLEDVKKQTNIDIKSKKKAGSKSAKKILEKISFEDFHKIFSFIPKAINALLNDIPKDSEYRPIAEIWMISGEEYTLVTDAIYCIFEIFFPKVLVYLLTEEFIGILAMLMPVCLIYIKKVGKTIKFFVARSREKKANEQAGKSDSPATITKPKRTPASA